MKKSDKERIKNLLEKYGRKIEKFREKHSVYIYCFPNGRKIVKDKKTGRFVYRCISFKRDIYYCKNLCNKQCKDFLNKIYLCVDIGCSFREECMSLPLKKRIKKCKKFNLLEERKKLDKTYNKFFLLMKVYRGLKINPTKTLRWLDKRKKVNGQVSDQKNRKKIKRKRKGK